VHDEVELVYLEAARAKQRGEVSGPARCAHAIRYEAGASQQTMRQAVPQRNHGIRCIIEGDNQNSTWREHPMQLKQRATDVISVRKVIERRK